MYAGRIVENATGTEFFNNPTHPYSKALLNSLPSDNVGKLATIKGQPPTITEHLEGCKFYPRCEYCMNICKEVIPISIQIAQNHYVACHLVK